MTPRIGAVVLAAGRSSRMGPANKLTLEFRGKPLVCHAVDGVLRGALEDALQDVWVVTGHEADDVRSALAGREVAFVHNPDYESGLASSIAAGIAAARHCDAALLCLGDMPDVPGALIEALIAAFDGPERVVLPVYGGRRGHPVLFGAAHFAALMALRGDRGARDLLASDALRRVEIECADAGIHRDIDTPEDL